MTVGAGERACGRVRRTPPTDGRAELFSTDDRHVFCACLGTQKKAAARNSAVVYPPCRLAAANSPQPASDRLPACPPTISSNSEDAAAGATCAGVDNSVMHAEMLRSKYFSLCVSVQRARSVSLHACRLPHIGYCVRRLFPWALKKRKKKKMREKVYTEKESDGTEEHPSRVARLGGESHALLLNTYRRTKHAIVRAGPRCLECGRTS